MATTTLSETEQQKELREAISAIPGGFVEFGEGDYGEVITVLGWAMGPINKRRFFDGVPTPEHGAALVRDIEADATSQSSPG